MRKATTARTTVAPLRNDNRVGTPWQAVVQPAAAISLPPRRVSTARASMMINAAGSGPNRIRSSALRPPTGSAATGGSSAGTISGIVQPPGGRGAVAGNLSSRAASVKARRRDDRRRCAWRGSSLRSAGERFRGCLRRNLRAPPARAGRQRGHRVRLEPRAARQGQDLRDAPPGRARREAPGRALPGAGVVRPRTPVRARPGPAAQVLDLRQRDGRVALAGAGGGGTRLRGRLGMQRSGSGPERCIVSLTWLTLLAKFGLRR